MSFVNGLVPEKLENTQGSAPSSTILIKGPRFVSIMARQIFFFFFFLRFFEQVDSIPNDLGFLETIIDKPCCHMY